MNEQDIKILKRAIKSAHLLHKNIEAIDFELSKFNKFEQKVSSFRLALPIAMGSTGLIVGAVIGLISAQKWVI